MEYGLIGAKLGHSYSKIIHEAVCGYSYELHPLPTEEEAHAFMQAKAFKAINVTIPYKKLVIPYCDEVEPRAAAIGAVNTVVNRDGKLYGYNTDYTGFAYLARCHGVKFAGAVVLVLGTGGTHNTVTAVCQDAGAKQVLTASRTGKDGALTYEKAQQHPEINIIINTTPAGMYPNTAAACWTCMPSPSWKPCWTAFITRSAPNFCSVRKNLACPPTVGSRCWWRRQCTRRSTLPAKSCRKL